MADKSFSTPATRAFAVSFHLLLKHMKMRCLRYEQLCLVVRKWESQVHKWKIQTFASKAKKSFSRRKSRERNQSSVWRQQTFPLTRNYIFFLFRYKHTLLVNTLLTSKKLSFCHLLKLAKESSRRSSCEQSATPLCIIWLPGWSAFVL